VYILCKQQSPAPIWNLTLSVQPKDADRNTTVLFATPVRTRTQRLTMADVMGHFSRCRLSKPQNCSYWGTWQKGHLYSEGYCCVMCASIALHLLDGSPIFNHISFNTQLLSGHYMYHQFNIQHSTFCPHSVFMCFVWIWEQTAIISLYDINWLVFITDTECVYCAVRNESLYTYSSV